MWKCGFFLLLLFHSFTAQAVSDSLLYPKAQLDAFKGRVAAAKKYADTATVLFRSVAQSPAILLHTDAAKIGAVLKSISAGKDFRSVALLDSISQPQDTFLLLRVFGQDTLFNSFKNVFKSVSSSFHQLRGYDQDATGFKTIPVAGGGGQWIYKALSKTKNADADLTAYCVFPSLEHKPLPSHYCRVLTYYKQLAGPNWIFWNANHKSKAESPKPAILKQFGSYLDSIAPYPKMLIDSIISAGYTGVSFDSRKRDSMVRVYKIWRYQTRWFSIDSAYAQDSSFKMLLKKATTAAIRRQEMNTYLVDLLAHYGSFKEALRINNFRFAIPIGCGNDYQNRLTILETAKLAAAASDWPIFMWTHLMASRITDKDGWDKVLYDWDNRRAYTKELEYLGIDMPQLLLGMALQADGENSRKIGDVANIWYESSNSKAIEKAFVAAASDTTLDLFNRMNCYWILAKQFGGSSYPTSKEERAKTLLKVAATLPKWSTFERKD